VSHSVMQKYLFELIAAAPPEQQGAAQAGVVFKTGQLVTGAIRVKTPAEGNSPALFELMTPGGMPNPRDPKSSIPAMVSFYFTTEALERVVTAKPVEVPMIQPVGPGGLIIPS